MELNLIFRYASFKILVLVICVCVLGWILPATGPAQSLPGDKSDVYLLGIIDPDDRKHIWALPAEAATGFSRQLAVKYPRKTIDGVVFYRVHSWRDTANLLIEAHAQQAALMVDLINRIERIKRSGPDRKLTRRVTALEKRLNESLNSGYR